MYAPDGIEDAAVSMSMSVQIIASRTMRFAIIPR
jgi:hypothetical protein